MVFRNRLVAGVSKRKIFSKRPIKKIIIEWDKNQQAFFMNKKIIRRITKPLDK